MLVPTYAGRPVEVIQNKNDCFVLIQGKYFRVSEEKAIRAKVKLRLVK